MLDLRLEALLSIGVDHLSRDHRRTIASGSFFVSAGGIFV
jgi:hypothetical protein